MAVTLVLGLALGSGNPYTRSLGAWEPGTDPLGNRRHGNWL
jgi:hypothetical protein